MTDCSSSQLGKADNFKMVQSWGVASARHTSGTLVYPQASSHGECTSLHCDDTERLLDVPIGPSIVRWDMSTKVRQLQFQAHKDIVTCMRMSPNKELIATSCYSGEIKLWDNLWNCLEVVNAPMASQHHLAWSHDNKSFIIVGNGRHSSLVMYNITSQVNDRDLPTQYNLKQAWQAKSGRCGDDNNLSEGQLPNVKQQGSSGRESAIEYHYGDAYYMGEITPLGNVIAVEERPERATLLELYSPEGHLIKFVELELNDEVTHPPGSNGGSKEGKKVSVQTLFMSTYRNGCYAIGVQSGTVIFVRENLEIMSTIKVGITGRTCVWDGGHLVLPTDSGKLVWWSMTGKKVREFKVGSPDYIVRLDWSVSGHSLWMCGFSTLSLLSVKRNENNGVVMDISPSHVIHSHEIACCGVGFSPSGRSLGSGDLAGNVWVTECAKVAPVYKYTVNASVRCLEWMSERVMLVGCLDGQVHQCVLGGSKKVLLELEGGVIHMKFNHSHQLLALCSTRGMLEVFSTLTSETERELGLKVVNKILAHPPKQGPQDIRFGQLGKQAEIWSLCWSPDDKRIATCSEDQTTKIWDMSTWRCITTLTGHTLAVTSVDWKEIGQQSLVATCSDDRTIRLTDGETFDLLKVLDTIDIYGWHTITYLSFHPVKDSPLLLCTTQNGHVVAWNSTTGERVTRGKMHLGSVEGLAWKKEHKSCAGTDKSESSNCCIATVGADCVVNLFNLV